MATFGYARDNTPEKDVENQRLEITRAGYDIDYWFIDEGVSGSIPAVQRPQFSALLSRICDGDQLVVTRLDRLGRDAQDIISTVNMLSERNIKVVVLQLGQIDLTSSNATLMMVMLAAVAEMERDMLIERTQAGLARARAAGKALGRPPKTTPQQRAAIINAYRAGTAVSELARTFKVSRATVLAIVKPVAENPGQEQVAVQDAPAVKINKNSTRHAIEAVLQTATLKRRRRSKTNIGNQ